jgi:hypothetical protein
VWASGADVSGALSQEYEKDYKQPETNMLSSRPVILAVLCGLFVPVAAAADELMIFPNADQTPTEQEQDKFTCYNWAKGESGFDPMAPPTATEPPPKEEPKRGGILRGAARGAVVGGIVDDDAGKGAAAGAVVGGMRRQDQKRKEAAERQRWEEEQARLYNENRNRYNRAYAACLEGKNYTVR